MPAATAAHNIQPPAAIERRAAKGLRPWVLAGVGLYAALTLALLPNATVALPEIVGIVPIFAVGVCVTEAATGFLLLVWCRRSRAWSHLALAAAYLFAAGMAALHVLTFPGALLAGRRMLGGPAATAWVFVLWVDCFAALALLATALAAFAPRRRIPPARLPRAAAGAVLAALALLALAAGLAFGVGERLPPLVVGSAWTALNSTLIGVAAAMLGVAAAVALLLAGRRDPVFLWLGLALVAVLAANLLSQAGGGRYTLGWTAGRLSWLVSAFVLFLFFMRQFAEQQRRLAAARDLLERRVRARTEALTETLRQRDALLAEAFHRVNNNLQVLDALIALERARAQDQAARAAFAALHNRVAALGLAEKFLLASPDKESVPADAFLRELAGGVSPEARFEAEALRVAADVAAPLGLLLTELLARLPGHDIALRRSGAAGELSIRLGDAAPPPLDRIVAALARQIGGAVTVAELPSPRIAVSLPILEPRR